jgi:hypothetical protein
VEFCADLKMCRSVMFGKRENKFYRKTEFFKENFAKNPFSEKKSLGTS